MSESVAGPGLATVPPDGWEVWLIGVAMQQKRRDQLATEVKVERDYAEIEAARAALAPIAAPKRRVNRTARRKR